MEAAGWRTAPADGFTGYAGPFWLHDEHGIGLLVEPRHGNIHGTLHGGMIATFADLALGFGVARVSDEARRNSFTASLSTQFLSTARVGEFITCKPEVIRQGRQLVFVRGLICVGERTIASADGIWKIVEERPGG